LSEQERSSLHEIEEFLQKISSDGSMGIHNFIFYEEILTNFDKRIKSIGKIN
jgi:hypothetical protein